MPSNERLAVYGIRHHGPGSARAVREAIDRHRPDVVLIEGPPEADGLVQWVGPGLVPPVAVLSYDVARPSHAAFWPFAVFSPEWQALSWAVEHHREVRFVDLPAANVLAAPAVGRGDTGPVAPDLFAAPGPDETAEPDETPGPVQPPGLEAGRANPSGAAEGDPERDQPGAAELLGEALGSSSEPDPIRGDPIAVLARTAGYDDPERWWDDVVESRRGIDPFDAITEAMAELRAHAPPPVSVSEQAEETRREAHMRQKLRAALRDHERVAVVCGAWHAPVLAGRLGPASTDQALLRRMPRVKVATTWVPWTHSRLAFSSGYGAGVHSPGWYQHLFTATDSVIERWFTEVARVLRRHDLPVSSAHAIEATRLADGLAVLRGRPMPGLEEVQEAALAVMCDGNATTLRLVTKDVVVGEELGAVPDGAPTVPLDADLRAEARSARLPLAPQSKDVVLDLRKDIDRRKSRLLNRARILGINWGVTQQIGGLGTFKEGWQIRWRPDFAVAIVVASAWGTTVASAAAARLVDSPGGLPDVTGRVERALVADLPHTLPPLLAALDDRAAHESDVAVLMEALPALVRAQRYGTVRGTDTSLLVSVTDALLARITAALPAALGGLSPEAAVGVRGHVDAVTAAVGLLGDVDRAAWHAALRRVLTRSEVPGLLAGRLTRTLLDAGELAADEARASVGRALSHRPTVADRAAFAEGFLSASALLLIHDPTILGVVDAWVSGLSADDFVEVLPVLRRAFGSFNQPERRAIADAAARLGRAMADQPPTEDLPYLDMAEAMATVRLLLRGRDDAA